jgi:hypothetical protein
VRQSKRAHSVLVIDGDQAHLKQGLDALQLTPVRIPHSDGDCALVWEKSIGEHSGHAWSWVGTGALACAEHESEWGARNPCREPYEVGFVELSPIRGNV